MADTPISTVKRAEPARNPLKIHFDVSCDATLRQVLSEAPTLFVETDAASADLVLFGTDVVAEVAKSVLYKTYKTKSFCVTESDIPTFRLPGLYAANQRGVLTARRTKTVNYFLSERARPNPEIRKLIGQPVEKRYLYSFMGGTNSWARRRVFGALKTSDDTLVESTDSYNHWAENGYTAQERAEQMRLRYAQVMAASKFTLCPRGCGLSSYRLFESMSLGVVPVIISDAWRPIEGIDWSFALSIREKNIAEADHIIREHEGEWMERGQRGQAVYRAMLQPSVVANMLHQQLAELVSNYDATREVVMGMTAEARASYRVAYWATYGVLKQVVLKASRLTGWKVPVKMRQPGQITPVAPLGTETPQS